MIDGVNLMAEIAVVRPLTGTFETIGKSAQAHILKYDSWSACLS